MDSRTSNYVKQHASIAAFPGVMMLLYYFFQRLGPARDFGTFYDLTFPILNYTMLVGGIAYLAIAMACTTGRLIFFLIDAIVTIVVGAVMLFAGLSWLSITKSIGLYEILFVMFGMYFLRSGYIGFVQYRVLAAGRGTHRVAEASTPPEPQAPHPASLPSDALPKDGDPPPEEGYLAALAKEKDK